MQVSTQLSLIDSPELDPLVIASILTVDESVREITPNDLRFGTFVHSINPTAGSLRVALSQILNRRTDVTREIVRVLTALRTALIKASILSLEEELADIVHACSITRVQPVLRYLGWDGQGGCTLEEAGRKAGITRERVRQLASKVQLNLDSTTYAPVLDLALRTISKPVARATDIERIWLKRGITTRQFNVEGVFTAATLLRRKCDFHVRTLDGCRAVLKHEVDRLFLDVRRVALQSCKKFTAMSLRELEVRSSFNELQTDGLSLAVETLPNFAWLDKGSGWFWVKSKRGRLLTRIRKILSVSNSISLGELRAGIARDHRMSGFAPPKAVLAEICSCTSELKVNGNTVVADPPLDWTKILGTLEQTFVRTLQEAGGLLTTDEFERKCIQKGMNRHSFYQYLSYSPILTRYAPGVYGLRGIDVKAGVAESLRPKRGNRGVLRDYGRQGGKIWLGYQLSSFVIRTGTIAIPSALKRFLEGSYRLRSQQSDIGSLGQLTVQGNRGWGLRSIIQREAAEPGDFLMLSLDPASREATVSFGPEEPWRDATLTQKEALTEE